MVQRTKELGPHFLPRSASFNRPSLLMTGAITLLAVLLLATNVPADDPADDAEAPAASESSDAAVPATTPKRLAHEQEEVEETTISDDSQCEDTEECKEVTASDQADKGECDEEAESALDSVLAAMSPGLREILESEVDAINDMAGRVDALEQAGKLESALLLAKEAIDRAAHFHHLTWQLQRDEYARQMRAVRDELTMVRAEAHQHSVVAASPPAVVSRLPLAMPASEVPQQVLINLQIVEVGHEQWQDVCQTLKIDPQQKFAEANPALIESLAQQKQLKIIAAPQIATLMGRSSQVRIGGSPEAGAEGRGERELQIDFLPNLTPRNTIRTDLRVHEAEYLGTAKRAHVVETGVETRPGQMAVVVCGPANPTAGANRMLLISTQPVEALAPSEQYDRRTVIPGKKVIR